MPRSLPSNPSVRFLQKEAKDLLKAHKNGDASCCATLRFHFRFSRADDEEILNAEVSLQEVQHALALDYGFRSWKELKARVETEEGNPTVETREATKMLSEIIDAAVEERASDLHIEQMNGKAVVRYRIDGALYEAQSLSREQGLELIDEVFRECNLDIKRREYPQDGRMLVDVDSRQVDIRVNVSPIIHGSAVAMRLLDRGEVALSLARLKMEPAQLKLFSNQIHASHGLIIVAGPTGSGKTTTLYATLNELKDPSRKIVTIEDPVEYALDGINQMRIRPEIGLGFEPAIRTALRQAPNVIMVGEIRSQATAQLLVQCALTGHLGFSTLHTNDCPSALTRLINMGVESWLVSDSVRCIVAQRLVREICEHCKSEHKLEAGQFASLQLAEDERDRPIYHGTGCEHCRQTGYSGRGAIYSILPMTPAVAKQVINKDKEGIQTAARAEGWTSLREAATRKLLRGETTAEEVLKFT